MAASGYAQSLLRLYHHVVLPREVPGKEDADLSSIERELLERLTRAVKGISPFLPLDDQALVDTVRLSFTTAKSLNVDGKIDKHTLVKELRALAGNNVLILSVTEQNAALLIYRQSSASRGDDEVIFEVFETSAVSEDVLASSGPLRWDFPGQAVALPSKVFNDDSFQEALAAFLEQASIESIKQFSAITHKAAAPLPEIRDTTNPALISGLLMAILEANGRIYSPTVLQKRVRDTISFKDAHKPWRRSPFYLVLRVSMQRHLYKMLGAEVGRLYYKTIMCLFLSHLLDDIHGKCPDETSHLLRLKLSRRLAKLEVDRDRIGGAKGKHDHLFGELRKVFDRSLTTANQFLEYRWKSYKESDKRIIRRLPQTAAAIDLRLQLPLSGPYLHSVLNQELAMSQASYRSPAELLYQWNSTVTDNKPFAAVSQRYLALSKHEEEVLQPVKAGVHLPSSPTDRCIKLAKTIRTYISVVGDAFDDYPELKGRMLLDIMELWMAMDQAAVDSYSLLRDYHPCFEANMLDSLQLLSLEEMQRLHSVQSYISSRCRALSNRNSKGDSKATIFSSPYDGCFAVRYVDNSARLLGIYDRIEAEAVKAREQKEKEWKASSRRHDQLTQQMAELSCIYHTYVNEYGEKVREHQKGCLKHKLKWQAKQIKIEICEHPLPSFKPAAKAAVFELDCPKAYAAYRDSTWLILETYAYEKKEPLPTVPRILDYSGLRNYIMDRAASKVSLGSFTKSHLDSHYAESGFPVPLENICKPCGLKLDYFDSNSSTWVSREEAPSFAHHFPLKLPPDSPYRSLGTSCQGWPSSNRILASQTKCPPDLNVHEFLAWQGLLLGTHCRWLSLLRELGSTNLNFSTESTWAVVSRLVLEVGPASNGNLLRDAHSVFRDVSFCRKLLEQVRVRLETIRHNFREPIQMDTLITILSKVLALATNIQIRRLAIALLETARGITWAWQSSVRSLDNEQSYGPSLFATWASVLCKRTFYILLDESRSVDTETLRYFIGSSIQLQNNMVGAFDTLPYNLRNAILQDLISAFSIRISLQDAVLANGDSLLQAVSNIWPVPAGASAANLKIDSDMWFFLDLESQNHSHLVIHYNVLYGTLLINGKQMGLLPPEFQKSPVVLRLFGTRRLDCFPSASPGMSLVIATPMPYGHFVHLGFRGDSIVVRAENQGRLLEYIPEYVFHRGHDQFDLPFPLVSGCYHWLDLNSAVMEIRQGDAWKSKLNNWRLDTRECCATRNKSVLVDPYSSLFKDTAQNFRYFEHAHHLTMYQPMNGPLRVELKRLELNFFVNKVGLLHSKQLDAVIVPSEYQDPGTWYGLQSKLVISSAHNHFHRSILIPLGTISSERDQQHVKVFIHNLGTTYLRFTINEVLGRIECPAEPRLLYTKALLHAYTSHFLPDRLTGRTGVEEALYHLNTGLYQPWNTLNPEVEAIVVDIAKLTPRRTYYPPALRSMESVDWNKDFTAHIQDDRYRGIVKTICQRSSDLTRFASNCATPISCPVGDVHLESRALSRMYAHFTEKGDKYHSRDCHVTGQDRINVMELSVLFSTWPPAVPTTSKLASLLEGFPIIGGYIRDFDKIQLTDILTIDLGLEWGAISQTCLKSNVKDKFRLMFLLAPMAFSSKTEMELIRVLAAYAILNDLKGVKPPSCPSYAQFKANETPGVSFLAQLMKGAKVEFVASNGTTDMQRGGLALRRISHENEAQHCCENLAQSMLEQWPAKVLDPDRLVPVEAKFLEVDEALEFVQSEWTRLAQNFELSKYVQQVQLILDRNSEDDIHVQHLVGNTGSGTNGYGALSQPQRYPIRMRGGEVPTLKELLRKEIRLPNLGSLQQPAGLLSARDINAPVTAPFTGCSGPIPRMRLNTSSKQFVDGGVTVTMPAHIRELSSIVGSMKQSDSAIQRRYGAELGDSIKALCKHVAVPKITLEPFNPTKLSNQLLQAKQCLYRVLEQIRTNLQLADPRAKWLRQGGLWPIVTPVTLLSELRSTSGVEFGEGAKEALVDLGLAVTAYQRLLRIQDASQRNRRQQLEDERANIGHQNWSPLEYSDWLLLEIDGDIMLRPEQVEVAQATISPPSGGNSVLQLLMGKGKTSCILPMVALVLADKQHLVRVVVPRALLLQSAQVMQGKIGGLLDRQVMHVPFSRKTTTDRVTVQTYCQLHSDLKNRHGIILALPEHILSFKLSGLQRLCDDKLEEAFSMIKAQGWLDSHARDIMDECDVSLAIRTQLIYPSGSQMNVDGHPLRWQTIQAVLRLVQSYLAEIQHIYPRSIEVVQRSFGGYPLMYILRGDAENHLITLIVDAICSGRTTILPTAEYLPQEKSDIKAFISSPKVTVDVIRRVTALFRETAHLMKVVYLLRGIFVHRILLSTLKKRWNVQYGLHPDRDPIAVPFLAKGVPSPSSEWGHPDVAIILTCLSFYYEGLNVTQFKQAFELLLKLDEPSIEYEKWTTKDLPESLQDYHAINVEDGAQLRELHQHIRYNVYLLDFYLNNFVFPRHAKQFTSKLQASGWDLVLYDPRKNRNCKTTGFSGTNDSRHQLPMTIRQNDLPEQSHTNAEVLSYLLEGRNRGYVLMVDAHGKRLSEDGLLIKLAFPHGLGNSNDRIRILIDGGAQILEHSNKSLAQRWLDIDYDATAAVFFDQTHRPLVLSRNGKLMPLSASPVAEHLEDCLVYLDESHCRGTDLKLPAHARAALTLGPQLTKDALAQAAMRLRLLGQSQSVTFFSPPEVHQSILDLRQGNRMQPVNSSDVIRWLLEQTCNGIEQMEPLYFTQGNNYLQRLQTRLDNPGFLHTAADRKRYLSIVRSEELQTLKQLYEPKLLQSNADSRVLKFSPALRAYFNELQRRKTDFQDRGLAAHSSALEEVEQEREIEHEVEEIREVQKPVHFDPMRFRRLHQDIEAFANTGRMPPGSDAYQPMPSALQKTCVAMKHGAITATTIASGLSISTEFCRTIKTVEPNDNFLRPCQWVLWSRATETALLVCPEEANLLIPILRNSTSGCHLIVYAAPVTRRMLHFNNLNYYAIPTLPDDFKAPVWLKIQLGIFSGRLYFGWDEYYEMLEYIGVATGMESSDEPVTNREAFAKKPLTFLHEWLSVRRKGQDFEHTPMGFVTTGKPLNPEHPFFLTKDVEKERSAKTITPSPLAPEAEDIESDSDYEQDDIYYDADEGHDGGFYDRDPVNEDSDKENRTSENGISVD